MDWPMFRRVERQANRMHEMMDRLGVDPGVLARLRQGEVYAEARGRCLHCGTSDRCLRWLDRRPPDQRSPDFCPSLPLFMACLRRDVPPE